MSDNKPLEDFQKVSRMDRAKKGGASCVWCTHFMMNEEVCRLAHFQRPPAHVIAFGCPRFEDDIPF